MIPSFISRKIILLKEEVWLDWEIAGCNSRPYCSSHLAKRRVHSDIYFLAEESTIGLIIRITHKISNKHRY